MEFKNVPKPVLCYFITENLDKEEYTPIIVPDDEPLEAFEFMVPRTGPDSPPATPFLLTPSISPADFTRRFSDRNDGPTPSVPDIEVIHATPTPTPTPPASKKSSRSSLDFDFQTPPRILGSPTPPPGSSDSDSDIIPIVMMNEGLPPQCPFSSKRPPDLDLLKHEPSEFMETMRRTSLSPLIEIETTENGVETPVSNKPSEDTPTVEKARKISEASSAAESVSNLARESVDETRKVSVASNQSEGSQVSVEEDLIFLHRHRSGSVSKKVEYFDSLGRQRRSGLSTTAYAKKPLQINPSDADILQDNPLKIQPPFSQTNPATVTLNGRPNRKSLDSQGSSGSND